MIKLILSITLIFSFIDVFTSSAYPTTAPTLEPYIRRSPDVDLADLLKIEPRLMHMVATVAEFCKQNNVKFVITSIIRTKDKNRQVGGISMTHVEGRAVDFSILPKWGWNQKLIDKLVRIVEDKHGEYGLYGVDKKQKVIVIHKVKGGVTHAHLQVTRNYEYIYKINNQLKGALYGFEF